MGIYLLPLAAIAFIWFSTALRMRIAEHGRPEHALLSNIQLACGTVYVAKRGRTLSYPTLAVH